MTNPFGDRSPAYYEELLNRLETFRDAYVPYVNATVEAVYGGQAVENTAERSRVLQLAALADEAMRVAGIQPQILPPPLGPGRPPIVGLSGVAFAHEDPMFRRGAGSWVSEPRRQPFELAVDSVEIATVHLKEMLHREQRRRRRPTYWVDRGLRALLGLPGYLISLLFGFDRYSLPPGRARALWALSVFIDAVAAVVGSASVFGWWS